MYQFNLEPDLPLLTVTRRGFWSLDTVKAYEADLRNELAKLHGSGRPTSFIIDIRSTGAQAKNVAAALQAMVNRLGSLNADRTAVVTSSGIAKLQAKRVANDNAEVFTSMVLARDWVLGIAKPPAVPEIVHDAPSDADAEVGSVHVHGPSDVDVTFTPAAAIETAKRISNAAIEVLVAESKASQK